MLVMPSITQSVWTPLSNSHPWVAEQSATPFRMLKALEVDVYFEEQNIHTMSADGELMLTILASYA